MTWPRAAGATTALTGGCLRDPLHLVFGNAFIDVCSSKKLEYVSICTMKTETISHKYSQVDPSEWEMSTTIEIVQDKKEKKNHNSTCTVANTVVDFALVLHFGAFKSTFVLVSLCCVFILVRRLYKSTENDKEQ